MAGGSPLPLDPGVRGREGGAIRRLRLGPQAQLEEDVRRHVERVARLGRDLGVGARRAETQPCVLGVVVVVQQVMKGPGMLGVRPKDGLENFDRRASASRCPPVTRCGPRACPRIRSGSATSCRAAPGRRTRPPRGHRAGSRATVPSPRRRRGGGCRNRPRRRALRRRRDSRVPWPFRLAPRARRRSGPARRVPAARRRRPRFARASGDSSSPRPSTPWRSPGPPSAPVRTPRLASSYSKL